MGLGTQPERNEPAHRQPHHHHAIHATAEPFERMKRIVVPVLRAHPFQVGRDPLMPTQHGHFIRQARGFKTGKYAVDRRQARREPM